MDLKKDEISHLIDWVRYEDSASTIEEYAHSLTIWEGLSDREQRAYQQARDTVLQKLRAYVHSQDCLAVEDVDCLVLLGSYYAPFRYLTSRDLDAINSTVKCEYRAYQKNRERLTEAIRLFRSARRIAREYRLRTKPWLYKVD